MISKLNIGWLKIGFMFYVIKRKHLNVLCQPINRKLHELEKCPVQKSNIHSEEFKERNDGY